MVNQSSARPIPTLEWHRLDSTCLMACAFDRQRGELYLRFMNNTIYRYTECHITVMERMLIASSIGQYYNMHIKDLYPTERIQS